MNVQHGGLFGSVLGVLSTDCGFEPLCDNAGQGISVHLSCTFDSYLLTLCVYYMGLKE